MNFFESQSQARRKTGLLVILLVMAVLCLIGMTQLLVMVVMRYGGHTALTLDSEFWRGFSWSTLGIIAAGITGIVCLASTYKMLQLNAGGSAVAQLLGGELLDRSSNDLHERKILNVVEEMAIASGVPVPPVYIIEDAAINAFAAGHDSKDVAIGITRGCVQLLSRDELQGVIAHEFSHIFNGDMKINLRLIGILHGILFIGLIGRMLLDGSSRRSWSGRSNRDSGPLIFLGIGLLVIGYAGTFFGNIIKAAICRQREFLADASAVQYTRNPAGIGGALKKIGGYTSGSAISHPNAAQISHLFFADGIHTFASLFATHPALETRILAIDPQWDGDFPDIDASSVSVEKPAIDPNHVHIVNGEIQYTPPALAKNMSTAHAALAVSTAAVASAIDAIGTPTTEHMAQARRTLNSIPENLLQLTRTPGGASAVVHCLLFDENPEARQQHFALLKKSIPGSVYAFCEKIVAETDALPVTLRLPLIDLCLPSLKLLDATAMTAFMNAIMAQIKADGRVSLFEWALYRLLRQHLDHKKTHGGHAKLQNMPDACRTVLSALALATHSNPQHIQQRFQDGWQALGLPAAEADFSVLDNMAALDAAVRQLNNLQALAKPRFLKACCASICRDNTYAAEAVELLRAIADSIDTPIPPIITNTEIQAA